MTLRSICIKLPKFESAFHLFENTRLLRIETKIFDCCSVDPFNLRHAGSWTCSHVLIFLLLRMSIVSNYGMSVGQLANIAAHRVPLHSNTIVVFQPLPFSYSSFSKGQFTHAIFVAPIWYKFWHAQVVIKSKVATVNPVRFHGDFIAIWRRDIARVSNLLVQFCCD